MKKVLLLTLVGVTLSFAKGGMGGNTQQMNQMQNQSGKGSMNQERNRYKEKQENKNQYRYKNQYKNGDEKSNGSMKKERGSMQNNSRGGMETAYSTPALAIP